MCGSGRYETRHTTRLHRQQQQFDNSSNTAGFGLSMGAVLSFMYEKPTCSIIVLICSLVLLSGWLAIQGRAPKKVLYCCVSVSASKKTEGFPGFYPLSAAM